MAKLRRSSDKMSSFEDQNSSDAPASFVSVTHDRISTMLAACSTDDAALSRPEVEKTKIDLRICCGDFRYATHL
ncbi:hypothetical protein RHMOL_Rhmol06G0085000 [Rhododendron molle]|uniref:Uncharacterized protein n=1 Tax=Rhododendron molle TaxID=49168 RepID=A0ACC0NC68_RHOML|nr:hypothetical protein RHMOL_Rhmol06G0085000 [Rhododendron molle]